MKIITLDNGRLKVDISTLGAEVVNVEKDGVKKIWDGKEEIWKGHSPILFPICSCLLGGYYEYKGKKYNLKPHGFAKKMEFEVVSEEKTSATFLLLPTSETKEVYPFDFEFRAHFKLDGDKLCVYYIVENKGNEPMYYNVGCHEAYMLDGTLNDYSILFEGEDKIYNTIYGENGLEQDKLEIELKDNKLNLSLDYFVGEFTHKGVKFNKDSIVIENVKNKRLTLLKGEDAEAELYFADFDHLVIWTCDNGFIAIEPWNGLPDFSNANHKIEDKKSISKLEGNSTKTYYHSIIFN